MSSPIPPIKVDIIAGQNTAVPELQRTGTEIARVAAGASGGLSPVQKLGKAMVLAEGREGSLVLRELRFGMTTMAAEALGATGHLGRLGIVASEFAVGGGPAALIAVTGLALGYRALTKDARDASAAADKLTESVRNQTIAGQLHTIQTKLTASSRETAELETASQDSLNPFVSAMALIRQSANATAGEKAVEAVLGVRAQRADKQAEAIRTLERQNAVLAAGNGIREAAIASGEDEATTLLKIAEATARATAETQHYSEKKTVALLAASRHAAQLKEEQAGLDATAALQRSGTLLEKTIGIRERAIATGQDENTTLVQIAGATAEAQAATLGLDTAHTAALVTQAKRVERLKEENATLAAQRDLLKELEQISSNVADFFRETPFFQETLQGIKVPTLPQLEAQESARQATADVSKIEKQGTEFAFGFDQSFFEGVQQSVSEALATTPGREKTDVQRIGQESLAEIAAIRSGDTGAGIAGAGALVSTLGAAKSAGGLGIAGLGPVGIGLSLAGTAFSLFDHSAERRHKEMLAALKRIEEKPIPVAAQVRPVFVGATPANAGQVSYDVGRFQDRDGVYRGVGES